MDDLNIRANTHISWKKSQGLLSLGLEFGCEFKIDTKNEDSKRIIIIIHGLYKNSVFVYQSIPSRKKKIKLT